MRANTTSIFARDSATVDFCEANYAVLPFVAEFHGTWSALAMTVLGVAGAHYAGAHGLARRYVLLWHSLTAVGVGTMYLHSTLAYFGQACDELPMLMTALGLFYCCTTAEEGAVGPHAARVLATFLCAFGAAMGAWSLSYKYMLAADINEPLIFPLIFGGIMCGLIAQEVRLYLKYSARRFRRLYERAAITFALGFGSWLVDQTCCASVGWMQMHTWWHLLTAASAHYTFVWIAAVNAESSGCTLPPSLLVDPVAARLFALHGHAAAYTASYAEEGGAGRKTK